jgi:pilus assembly protein Flp/PilA
VVKKRKPAVLSLSQLSGPNCTFDLRETAAQVGDFGLKFGGATRRPEMAKFLKLIRNDEGATAIEYGLIAALIAVAAIGAMTSIGSALNETFSNVASKLHT